jgi:hypothetical protein
MGEKLFAVPWQALHLDTVNHRFVLNVEKERLRTAPGFNKDSWPDMSDVNWSNQIHAFYGTDPNRSGAPTMGPGSSGGSMSGMAGGAGRGAGSGMGAMGGGMGAGSAGSSDLGTGAGSGTTGTGAGAGSTGLGKSGSLDPSPGTGGDDKSLSHIRGSNIG